MMANHMTEVAQMLGVEIGEVFKITDDTYGIRQSYYRLTEENGCEISDDNTSWVTVSAEVLKWLIMGDVRISKLPWKPHNGEFYFSPSPTRKSLRECLAWVGGENDNYRLNRGFVFRTPDEAVAVARKMLVAINEQ